MDGSQRWEAPREEHAARKKSAKNLANYSRANSYRSSGVSEEIEGGWWSLIEN